jgi:hypothetical protein
VTRRRAAALGVLPVRHPGRGPYQLASKGQQPAAVCRVEPIRQRITRRVIGRQQGTGPGQSGLGRSGTERDQRAVSVEKHDRVGRLLGHHRFAGMPRTAYLPILMP